MSSATTAISLQQGKTSPGRVSLTVAYFASFTALGLTTGSLGPTLPSLATQANVSLSEISYLFTARSIGYVFGSMRGGRLFDCHSGNSVMSALLVVMAAGTLLIPFSTHLWFLLGVMFVFGAAEAGVDVGASTLLVRVHGVRVAPFMNAMHAFFGVGALIAPIVVAQISLVGYPPSRAYFVLGMLILPVALYTFRLPGPAAREPHQRSATPIANRLLIFCLAGFLFLYVGAEVGFAGWIFTYAIQYRLGSVAAAAYLTSIFWGSLTAGRLLLIPITARVRPELILISSIAGSLLSLVLMQLGSHSLPVVSAAAVGLGVSMASIFPATVSFAGRHMEITGKITGWLIVGSSLGATLIPLIMGQLISAVGPAALIGVTTLAMLVSGGVLVFVIRQAKRIWT